MGPGSLDKPEQVKTNLRDTYFNKRKIYHEKCKNLGKSYRDRQKQGLAGEFPEEWDVGIIIILFKGGESNGLNNYRGITC